MTKRGNNENEGSNTPRPYVKFRDIKDFQPAKWTIGTYLAARMYEIGITDYFVVPGDYNLALLDEVLLHPKMQMISCCNELNAGYAADGYARARGAGVCFVTFTVGGLSVINAIAGSYSDDLPVLCVSGGINSNDFGSNRTLHHTTGLAKKNQQIEMFEKVVCHAAVISHVTGAKHIIDRCFREMLSKKKPVYLEISCNVAQELVADPIPFYFKGTTSSSPEALQLALAAAKKCWDAAVKPVIVIGVGARAGEAVHQCEKLVNAANCAVAVMPDAKGLFPEDHKNFIGTYWGSVSTPGCANIIESADLYLFVGPNFNDYTTVGYSVLLNKKKMMIVQKDRVNVPPMGNQFGVVKMKDFLDAFAEIVKPNHMSMEAYERFHENVAKHAPSEPGTPLLSRQVQAQVQDLLSCDTAVIAETGDSWFHGQRLRLPRGCGYEFQMQYGSIGWSVGALLGYALALKDEKRVIAMIGDGSFQVTCQDISTIMRYKCNPIIFLMNNKGYTIEVEIHDGPYNVIKNWDYVKLIEAMSNNETNAKAVRVDTELELIEAVKQAKDHDGMFFIECTLDKDDCTAELLEWGARVAAANSRKHKDAEEVL